MFDAYKIDPLKMFFWSQKSLSAIFSPTDKNQSNKKSIYQHADSTTHVTHSWEYL